jgi:hypothetical protein
MIRSQHLGAIAERPQENSEVTEPAQKKDGITLPLLIIDDVKYDISKLIDDELKDLMTKISLHIVSLNRTLSEAKTKAYTTGEYSNPAWFIRIKRLRELRGLQHQCVQDELSRRNKLSRTKHRTIESYFMDAARQGLSESGFALILDAARKMQAEDREE